VNHYYPFGGVFASSGNVQPYKYNGKELDTKKGLNWYDYGARHYDAALGRWLVVDPLAEKDYLNSPYSYCGNNPIIRVDKNGKIWDTVWDFGNLLYDIGSAVVNHIKGNHEQAQTHWQDAGVDALAMAIPGMPAGISKLKYTDDAIDAVSAGTRTDKAVSSLRHVDAAELKSAEVAKPYTKSNLKLGQEMHKKFHSGEYGKEFRLPSGKRIDFLDIDNKTIYELKPFNPRAVKQGEKQLQIYKRELETIPRFQGWEWNTKLETY
jgi:RHS repeat-associated protein